MENVPTAPAPHLTLGGLIKKIEKLGVYYGEKNERKHIQYDFGLALPTHCGSWRGSYDQVALGYRMPEFHYGTPKAVWHEHADVLLKNLKEAVGQTFYGYKGGAYKMQQDTLLWVDNYGMYSGTYITDVVDKNYRLILITACEID